jgi:hypothetical protein
MRNIKSNKNAQFYLIEVVAVVILILSSLILVYSLSKPSATSISTTTQLKKLADDTLFYLTNVVPTQDYVSATSDCVGRWSFEEGPDAEGIAYDTSGNDNNGVIHEAIYTNNSVHRNYAISFDGVNDYIDCGNDAEINLIENFTVAGWVNCKDENLDTNEYGNFLIQQGNIAFGILSGNGEYDSKSSPYNKITLVWEDSAQVRYMGGTTEITNDTWYHIAVTYSTTNNKVKIYLNSDLDAEYSPADGPLDSTESLKIGVWSLLGSGYYFNGDIDEVLVWNKTLSWAQINSTYNLGILSGYDNILTQWIISSDETSYNELLENMSMLLPNHIFYSIKIFDGISTREWYVGENRELADSIVISHRIISYGTRIYDVQLEVWSIL